MAGLVILASQPLSGQPPHLTVERIASLPSLTGTAPSRLVWSPDSTWLAFLWNDSAMPFRDIWIAGATAGAPKRITDMARTFPSPEPSDPDPSRALAQRAEARSRGGISEMIWTLDGQALAFGYRGDLFRVNADGTGLKRLTTTGGGKSNLAFSPDGRFLSFLQGGDLWLWNQKTNELVQATRVAVPTIGTVPVGTYYRAEAEIGTYVWGGPEHVYIWSPDSRYIALHCVDRRNVRKVGFPYYLSDETSMNVHRRAYPGDENEARAIGLYDPLEGRIRMIDLDDKTSRLVRDMSWSPDGKQLLIDQASDDAVNRWIYLVTPEDRSVKEIWRDRGETRVSQAYTVDWHSDGQGIVFTGDLDDRYRLYSLPPGSRTPKRLTDGDWDVAGGRGAGNVTVSPRTKEIFFVSNQKNPYERHAYRMPEQGGTITQISSLPGMHQPFVSPDGLKVALLHSNDVTPTELYLVDAKGGSPERRITHSPPKEFYSYTWIQPRYVTFKSRIDNYILHGRVIEPPNLDRTKKYPVVLGPVYSNTVRNEWRGLNGTLQQLLALEGQYIGLQVDVRGSTGYGRAFREEFLMDWGGEDLDDLQSGVEYLKTLPYVDGARVGVWGSSYGGLLTVFSLLKKPGLFKAGVAGAPAVDPHFFGPDDICLTRLPTTFPEAFSKGNALATLGQDLQDHLLIIHGMQDDVVPFKTSVMLAERLMLLGKDFDFAFAPGAPHGWSTREHYAVYLLRKLVQYFDRYLGPGPRPSGAGG